MDQSSHENIDDLVDRYKAKVWTFIKSCSRKDRFILLVILTLIPPAWAGFIYWNTRLPSSIDSMSNKEQIEFFSALIGIMVFTYVPFHLRFSAIIDIIWHIICALFILPALSLYQKFRRICSLLSWLALPLARVCTTRKRRRWDKTSPSVAVMCNECRRIVDKSTILNGSILGLTYPVEKYRHLKFTTLSVSAQQCRLCDLFLNAIQNSCDDENSPGTAEKQDPQLQVELRVARSSNGRSSVVLRLHCSGLLEAITLPVDEIHYSMSELQDSQ
jgi:hypothetical protein